MARLLFFFTVVIVVIVTSLKAEEIKSSDYDVIYIAKKHNFCSKNYMKAWTKNFESCFINTKYKKGPNLFNIVTRLLDHSKNCILLSTPDCRPDQDSFVLFMSKLITLIKEHSSMYVERLIKAGVIVYGERDKIQDLNCVENVLTKNTYLACFDGLISTSEELLGENETYDLILQNDMEKAISCTNKVNEQCSKSIKNDLNKMVRYILGMKQPQREKLDKESFSNFTETVENTEKTRSTFSAKPAEEDFKIDTELSERFGHVTTSSKHPTEPRIFTELFQSSLVLSLRKKDDPNFSEFSSSTDVSKDTEFQTSKEDTSSTETVKHTEETTSTNFLKLTHEHTESDSEHGDYLDHSVTTPPELVMFTEQFPSTLLPKLSEKDDSHSTELSSSKQHTEFPRTEEHSRTVKQSKLTFTSFLKARRKNAGSDIELTDYFEDSETTSPPKLLMTTEFPEFRKLFKLSQSSSVRSTSNSPRSTERPKSTRAFKTSSTSTKKPSTSSSSINHNIMVIYSPRPTQPPRPWYDYIIQPFVSLWNTIKSWFGF